MNDIMKVVAMNNNIAVETTIIAERHFQEEEEDVR